MRTQKGLADSFFAALTASLFLQAGAAGFLSGDRVPGYLLISIGSAILIARLKAAEILSNERLFRLAIATLLAAWGIELFVGFRFHGGGLAPIYTPDSAADVGSGKYRGVILWTDAQPAAVFVPPPPELSHGTVRRKPTLSIPFDGVYWFYKFPDRKPPRDSYTVHGNPSATSFRSSDFVPLQMEARQDFVNLLDMSCCSRIGVEVLNADRGPGIVSLELILSNTLLPGEPFQSLGRMPVTSIPQGPAPEPANEVLSFAIPADPRIRQFDAATVRFIRAGGRGSRSAKIAIKRFTLVPRGL